jgi:hypothetical protein
MFCCGPNLSRLLSSTQQTCPTRVDRTTAIECDEAVASQRSKIEDSKGNPLDLRVHLKQKYEAVAEDWAEIEDHEKPKSCEPEGANPETDSDD